MNEDPLKPARGCANAMILGFLLWVIVAGIVWLVTK
jgi:hypothetical protein